MPALDVALTAVLAELQLAREESDRLFGILKPEAIYGRPIAERHRTIFYIGHLDGFDSIQICREGLGLESPDPELDKLFQAGIDPDSAHLPSDKPSDWPSLERVEGYVQRCRRHVDRYMDRAPEETLFMALEHRLMHLETLAYMFHNLDHDLSPPLATKRAFLKTVYRPLTSGVASQPAMPSWGKSTMAPSDGITSSNRLLSMFRRSACSVSQ